jgi:hypothetical protein
MGQKSRENETLRRMIYIEEENGDHGCSRQRKCEQGRCESVALTSQDVSCDLKSGSSSRSSTRILNTALADWDDDAGGNDEEDQFASERLLVDHEISNGCDNNNPHDEVEVLL